MVCVPSHDSFLAGDGTIDFNEFLGLMRQLKADVSQGEDDLVDVFRVLDQDGDGYISQADLRDIIVRYNSRQGCISKDSGVMLD